MLNLCAPSLSWTFALKRQCTYHITVPSLGGTKRAQEDYRFI